MNYEEFYALMQPQNCGLLLAWLGGDRTVKLAQHRALGFSTRCCSTQRCSSRRISSTTCSVPA